MIRLILALLFSSVLNTKAFAATLPVAATDVAQSWDSLYWFLIWVSGFFFVGIVLAMIIFVVKYRKKVHKESTYIHGHTGLEIVWTVIPTIILFIMFGWGWNVYEKMTHAPSDSMEVYVVGKQWLWQFVYKNGTNSIGDLYVPQNKPVKLIMSSEDVIHSMFIPNFRVKQDVVPGMYTHVWFEAKVLGIHQIFCTEYCGTSHSGMLGRVIVLDDQQWKDWQDGKKIDVDSLPADPSYPGFRANHLGEGLVDSKTDGAVKAAGGQVSLAEKGKAIVAAKGCVSCHSADGSRMTGPSFKGIYGNDVKLTDGSTVKVDDNYIRESIENPTAKIVEGFPPAMPPYKGLVDESEIMAITEYIKSLK